eukprot:362142-Chlamydomonas_euryale.AAC.5
MGMTCYKYAVWCIPENRFNDNDKLNWHELYDLGLDPYELTNRCGCGVVAGRCELRVILPELYRSGT